MRDVPRFARVAGDEQIASDDGVFAIIVSLVAARTGNPALELQLPRSIVKQHLPACAGPHLPGELTGQIDEALGQLRIAQVSAENRASQQGQKEENDLGTAPAPPSAGPGR